MTPRRTGRHKASPRTALTRAATALLVALALAALALADRLAGRAPVAPPATPGEGGGAAP